MRPVRFLIVAAIAALAAWVLLRAGGDGVPVHEPLSDSARATIESAAPEDLDAAESVSPRPVRETMETAATPAAREETAGLFVAADFSVAGPFTRAPRGVAGAIYGLSLIHISEPTRPY